MSHCAGLKRNGEPCRYKAKYGNFCGIHCPKEDTGDMAECPICYDVITSKCKKVLSCEHVFHKGCVQKWLQSHTTCPMCRAQVVTPRAPVPRDEVQQLQNRVRRVESPVAVQERANQALTNALQELVRTFGLMMR
jgi:hypothetical protein